MATDYGGQEVRADYLLTNAVILTLDEQFHQYEPGALAIKGDSILAVGPQQEITNLYQAKETIDCGRKVLMPGLVNAHTHAPMTLLRGLADDLRLDVWLMGFMMPVERQFVSPDFVRLGTQIACMEMIRSGVTCFADMYYFEEHTARATAEIGMRAVCSETILKFPSPDARFFEESLTAAHDFIAKWKGHPLIVPSVAPHAAYTCTDEILRATVELALHFDVPLHTHIAETALEQENWRSAYGMPVVPYLKKLQLFDAKTLAAHCVHLDDGELQTLQHYQTGVAHNPSSNLKLASGFAPVYKMLELGLNVGIGTDGPASNNDLDMFEEVRLAALLAKNVAQDPTALPARTALSMATRMGANALHIGDLTGSLEAGKRADLILVDIHQVHSSPRFQHDPNSLYAQLVYTGKASDVCDVMVNGRWLMRERQISGLDEIELLRQADEYARQIDIFLIQREKSVLSKLIAIGGTVEQESFEVQAKMRVSDPQPVLEALNRPDLEILRYRHYHEFDTYFLFSDPEFSALRYREDQFIEGNGQISQARYRLTLIGAAREHHFSSDVLLSRSRYLAQAAYGLRFYREYFKPQDEVSIEKDRQRWRVLFRGTEFYINLDRIDHPAGLGYFLEVKSRTWSRRDAEHKANAVEQLLDYLGVTQQERVTQDYIDLARGKSSSK